MQIDTSKLGHRWKGAYNAAVSYTKGDVVRVGDNVKVIDASGNLSDFAQGQQSISQKGEILTNQNTPVVGKAGQVLHNVTVAGNLTPQWKYSNERTGTKAVALVHGSQPSQMHYANANFAGAVMNDGTVRVWGRRRYGENGSGDINVSRGIPWQVPFPQGTFIVKAWRFINHMFAVDKDGQLWGTGYTYSGNGSSAQQNTMVNISQTSDIGNDPIVDLTSEYGWHGYQDFFAIGQSGRVYAWGVNRYGSLGLGDTTTRYSPTLVPFTATTPIAKVFSFSAYYHASHFIDTEGFLWGSGYGDSNLVNPSTINTHQKNASLHGGYGVAHISSHESAGHWTGAGSYYRSAVITMNNGDLLVSAISTGGQVGWGSLPNSTSSRPRLQDVWNTNVAMCAVKNGGYDQAIALKKDGTVEGIGYSPLSGTGANSSVWTQYPVITGAVDQKGLGSRHGQTIAIRTSSGLIYDWGYNNGAGSGLQQSYPHSNPLPVVHSRPFVDHAKAGVQYDGTNNHWTIALDDQGDVWTWGSGNFEGTDPNDGEDAYVPTQVKF